MSGTRDHPQTVSFRRRNLPHWLVADRPHSVTFRLKESIPKRVLAELDTERMRLLGKGTDPDELNEFHRRRFERIDAILDACACGPDWLRDPRVAQILMRGFIWLRETKGWNVLSACVMPNHVHVLLKAERVSVACLADHLGKVKWHTAVRANRLLKRTGQAFRTPENFDHWCRTAEETEGKVRYIRENPVTAGLVDREEDWPWSV